MKPIHLLAGLCVAGFLAGAVAKRLSGPAKDPVSDSPPETENVATGSADAEPAENGIRRDKAAKPSGPAMNHIRSKDTLETLLAVPDDRLYARLAAWMTDAGEKDIAAFWEGYRGRNPRSNDITDLVFLNWARISPRDAIDTLKGGNDEHYAWWAWACHDPKAALAAALAENQDRVNNVTWGIGEFHPEWLREHINELPEWSRSNAFQGMMKWEDLQDPLASLKFMKEHKLGTSAGTLKALALKDPWAALDWAKENAGNRRGNSSSDSAMDMVIQTIAENSPEDLQRLIARTPSGMAKVKMERAAFNSLLASDPVAALDQAKNAPAPRTAAERYAAIGQGLVKSDPEKAFQVAKDLLTACPDAINPVDWVRTPGSGSGSGVRIPGVNDFIGSLMTKDASRVMEMASTLPGTESGRDAVRELSSQWAEQDLPKFVEWVNQQPAGKARDNGADIVIIQLTQDGHHEEAMEWAASMSENQDSRVDMVVGNWASRSAEDAKAWLESSGIPEERKQRLIERIEQRASRQKMRR